MKQVFELINRLRILIARNDVEESINILIEYVKDKSLKNEAILLSSRFAEVTKQIRMGIVTDDFAQTNQNKIKHSILGICDELEKESQFPVKSIEYAKSIRELEDELWESAKQINDKNAYLDYLAKSHYNIYVLEASNKIKQIDEVSKWRVTLESNSIVKYQSYINEFPSGRFVEIAWEKVKGLKEVKLWEEVKLLDSIDGYRKYIQISELKYNIEEAKYRIEYLIEQNEWLKAQKIGTVSSYENYMKKYPNGLFMKSRKNIVDLIEGNDNPLRSYQRYSDINEISEPERRFYEIYSELVIPKQKRRDVTVLTCDFILRIIFFSLPSFWEETLSFKIPKVEHTQSFWERFNADGDISWILLKIFLGFLIATLMIFHFFIKGLPLLDMKYNSNEYQFVRTLPKYFKSSLLISLCFSVLVGLFVYFLPSPENMNYTKYYYEIVGAAIVVTFFTQSFLIRRNNGK